MSTNVEFKDGTAGSQLEKKSLNDKEAINLKKIQLNDDLHSICINILSKQLFSRHVQVAPESESAVDKDLQEFIKQYWTEEFKILYPDIKALGYVAFILEQVTYKGKDYDLPKKVDRDDYIVCRYRTKRYSEMIVAEWKNKIKEEMPEIYIFVDNLSYPEFTSGQHNSTISATVGHSLITSDMFDCYIMGVKQLTNPVIVFQRTATSLTIEDQITATERVEALTGEAIREKEVIDTRAAANAMVQADEYFIDKASSYSYLTDSHGPGAEQKRFNPSVIDRKYCMPPHWEVSPTQPTVPTLQPNILEFRDKLETHISAKYGIPISILNSGSRAGTQSKANAIDDNDMTMFSQTIQSESMMICKLAQFIFSRSAHQTPDLISFVLRTRPYMTTGKVLQLYDFDVISEDVMKNYVAQLSNIPECDILKGKNKHDRPPLNGNENQTDLLMGKKARALDGDYEKNHGAAQESLARAKKTLAEAELVHEQTKKTKMETKKVEAETAAIERGDNEGSKSGAKKA
jgi:hypothetical protein